MSRQGYGYTDDNDESLKTKSGGKFGLNSGFITKFEYNANAGKDGALADAIDIHVKIGDKEYRNRVYDITGALYGKDNVLIEPNTDGYDELFNEEIKQRQAVIVHIVKALGINSDTIKTALSSNPQTFADWAKIMTALPGNNFQTFPVDVFLEYQWKIQGDNKMTFTQLPKNMKGGRWLCSAINPVGQWKRVEGIKELIYKDDAGNEHPFTRSENYMESNKAVQQFLNAPTGSTQTNQIPKKSTWKA